MNRELGTTTYALTFDPQLILLATPHVGLTLGALLELGVLGEAEAKTEGQPWSSNEFSETSYGVSGGLVALF